MSSLQSTAEQMAIAVLKGDLDAARMLAMNRRVREVADIFKRWLEFLDSHDGRLHRRKQGGEETDMDCVATIPNPPGSRIFTVSDLRVLVAALESNIRAEG